jgi:cytochrome c-type biogenesis protein CcmH
VIWVLTLFIGALAAALVVWPMFRPPPKRVDRERANVAAYRQRLRELDVERETGLIDDAAHAGAVAELNRRLLAEAPSASAVQAETPRDRPQGRWWVLVCVGLMVPMALFAYWQAGSWRVQERIQLAQENPEAAMRGVAEDLAETLRGRPDAEGYAVLGGIWSALDEPRRSAEAYAEANRLSEQRNPDWLVAEAEVLGALNNRDLRGRPRALFDAALEIEPMHPRGLWFAGIAALQDGRRADTVRYWRLLMEDETLPSEMREALRQRLAELDQDSPADADLAVPSSPGVWVEVDIDTGLLASVEDGAVLFVFARNPEGPPMPVAAARIAGPEFPLRVRLDDRNSLNPGQPLSGHEHLLLAARLSRAGDANVRSGDIESEPVRFAKGDDSVSLQLTRERP